MDSRINGKLRIHLSKNPIEKLVNKSVTEYDGPTAKPLGLWYGFGRDWIDYVESNEMNNFKGSFIYYVKIKDMSRVLQLNTNEKIEEFTLKYYNGRADIYWKKVAEDFSGIELFPWPGKLYYKNYKLAWAATWDIASGCIWDTSIIELKQIFPKI
jgi:hypothetical protein